MYDDKKNINGLWAFLAVVFCLILISDYLLRFGFIDGQSNILTQSLVKIFYKLQPKMTFLRFSYLAGVVGVAWIKPSGTMNKNSDEKNNVYFLITGMFFIGLLFLGYTEKIYLYDLVVYPFIMLSLIWLVPKIINKYRKNFTELTILGISKLTPTVVSFVFVVLIEFERQITPEGKQKLIAKKTDTFVLHDPREGVWIEGGAGSGKSAFLFNNIIDQAAEKGFAGVIYDYEGNPLEEGSPVLSTVAYNSLLKYNSKTRFAFINFADMTRTFRTNPMSAKYLRSNPDIIELANVFMKALDKKMIKDADFWANSAISVITAAMLRLRNSNPEHCTIPHLIVYMLSDHNKVFKWLMEDEEVAFFMRPTATAYEEEAASQLSGVLGSLQVPITKLLIPEVFWVFSKDEIDLDITNKKLPTMLCIGNSPVHSTAISPAVSILLAVVKQQMNQMGRQQSIFLVDECNTVFINDLDVLPAVARKKGVATILGTQLFPQMEEKYGKTLAENIRGNCGTQFIGRTPNPGTQEYVSKMLGKVKRTDVSYSTSKDGDVSNSESQKFEDVMQARDIGGQETGQFVGKIAGGKPPYFQLQFDIYDFSSLKEKIPQFSISHKTGDEEMDRKIMNNLVDANYKKIFADVKKELEQYA